MRFAWLAAVLLSVTTFAAEERVWVNAEILYDGKDKIISVSGSVLKKEYEEVVLAERKGFLNLAHIFWFDGPRIVRQVDQGGFAGKTAYRIDTVLRITLYSEEYIAKVMPELMAPPKGGLLPEKPLAPPRVEF